MTALIIQEPIDDSGYLTYTLAQEVYWIDIFNLNEIFGMGNTTSAPPASEFVTGVIGPGGKIISFDSGEEAWY